MIHLSLRDQAKAIWQILFFPLICLITVRAIFDAVQWSKYRIQEVAEARSS